MSNAIELYRQGLNGLDLTDEKRRERRMDPAHRPNQLQVGDYVKLSTPDNLRLDGTLAQVRELTEWGAHLAAPAAGSGQYRAMHSEMRTVNKSGKIKAARDEGYTGDCCEQCGSFKMKRNGACLVCCDCGHSGGCG